MPDFARCNFQISLWYMDKVHDQQSFKIEKFWEKVLHYMLENNDDQDITDLKMVTEEALDFNNAEFRGKFYKKRALFGGLMDIGLGTMHQRIGVWFYPQIKIAQKILCPASSMLKPCNHSKPRAFSLKRHWQGFADAMTWRVLSNL